MLSPLGIIQLFIISHPPTKQLGSTVPHVIKMTTNTATFRKLVEELGSFVGPASRQIKHSGNLSHSVSPIFASFTSAETTILNSPNRPQFFARNPFPASAAATTYSIAGQCGMAFCWLNYFCIFIRTFITDTRPHAIFSSPFSVCYAECSSLFVALTYTLLFNYSLSLYFLRAIN